MFVKNQNEEVITQIEPVSSLTRLKLIIMIKDRLLWRSHHNSPLKQAYKEQKLRRYL